MDLYTCAVNVEEIWRGSRPAEHERIQRLLGGLRIAPLGLQEGERAGRWRRAFASEGTTLSQADCLVAAAALGIGAALATGDRTGFPMPELQVERWDIGA